MSQTFESLGLDPRLVQAVTELGYTVPSPIQAAAIPALLAGTDILGQAQTGTGKTAAFALPMLQQLDPAIQGVQALVLTPTRELATQVSEAIYRYGKHVGVRVVPIYGGQSYSRQMKRLERDVHIVVGTPGRTLDLIKQGVLRLEGVKMVVLDEADRMLDMGFIDDVEAILAATATKRQTALFSATFPTEIRDLANNYMRNPQSVSVSRGTLTVPQTEQRYYLLHESSKLAAMTRLLETEDMQSALIFTRTKAGASELADQLLARGFAAEALHGDLAQEVRETVLRRFRREQVTILVATDVVARGVDIPQVSHVFNFDIPLDPEDYVHRIGRTGRAGRSGVAITLLTPREKFRLKSIERLIKQPVKLAKLPGKDEVRQKREERFTLKLSDVLAEADLNKELTLVRELVDLNYDLNELAAAAIKLARVNESNRLLDDVEEIQERPERSDRSRDGRPFREHAHKSHRPGEQSNERGERRERSSGPRSHEPGMVRMILNVGREHGIQPKDVVYTIASETGIPGRAIGAIEIRQRQTYVDVKEIHAEKVLRQMEHGIMRGQRITLVRADN
ncbi:MAG: DEAD/DEAH box helicase [Chloroflexi bacterium]|nr:DEAD/DEAH box helicase [Chloroflexota bacterium]